VEEYFLRVLNTQIGIQSGNSPCKGVKKGNGRERDGMVTRLEASRPLFPKAIKLKRLSLDEHSEQLLKTSDASVIRNLLN
jgi:hypothetical protein